MAVVFLHQLHEHLVSLRVQISLCIVLVFFLLNGAVYSWRILDMREDDGAVYADVERRIERVETVADAVRNTFRVVNTPTGTEFMTEGGFNWLWGSSWLSAETGHYPDFSYGRDTNMWMDRFDVVDWTFIVRLILSFLCIVLAYDGISGEAERGTLHLLLANPISRVHVLLAKYVADLAVLVSAFLTGSAFSIGILSLTGALELTLGLVWGYSLYLMGTVLYLTMFLLFALGVSALTRSSISSLVMLALSWAVLTVVLPQSSYLVAVRSVALPPVWNSEQWEYRNAVRLSLRDDGLIARSRERAAEDGFVTEQRRARILRTAERDQFRIGERSLDRKVERYRVARAINLLSPAYAFQYTVEALLGTGLAKRQSFIRQAFDYRQTLRAFLRDQDAADADSPHILFFPDYMSLRVLDTKNLSRFVERPLSPREGLAFSVAPLVVLLLEALAAFLFALWTINRVDSTGFDMTEE